MGIPIVRMITERSICSANCSDSSGRIVEIIFANYPEFG